MSGFTDRLQQVDTWSEELVAAMLDVIDAAEQVAQPMTRAWQAIALREALSRFREVAERPTDRL